MNKLKKWHLAILFFIFALSITFILIQKDSKAPDVGRMALVDSLDNNFFVRGNNVFLLDEKKNRYFAYETLRKNIKKTLSKNNQNVEDFYLIDVSLLDLDEYFAVRKERAYFEQNPKQGEFINFSTLSPELFFIKSDNFLADNYYSTITEFLTKINQDLAVNSEKNIVIYAHCDSGRDRTGFISASYRMLFKQMDLKEAVATNITEAGRNSEGVFEDAIINYCLYLQRTHPDLTYLTCQQ